MPIFNRFWTERYLSTAIETSGLDYASADSQSSQEILGISPQTWTRVLVVAALFAGTFWHNLVRLWLKTNPFYGEANWSHSIVVPVIGLYYLFIHREELLKAHSRSFIYGRFLRPTRFLLSVITIAVTAGIYFLVKDKAGIAIAIIRSLALSAGILSIMVLALDWGLACIFFGLAMFVYGINPGKNDYLSDMGMIITLFGIALVLNGPDVMKIAWFPIVFLICAIPWPGLVYSWVAEPLSQLAAKVAVHVLQLTGVDSVTSGTKIVIENPNPMLPPRVLNVAEACAGMRSLMTFIAVAGAVAFLSPRHLWQRIIIVASAIPIAISCNVMRISGQGLLDHYVSPELSESFAHQFVGMMMLLPAFVLILLVSYVLDKMFIEEADDTSVPAIIPVAIQPNVNRTPVAVASREATKPAILTPSAAAPAASARVATSAPLVAKLPIASIPPTAPVVAAAPRVNPPVNSDSVNRAPVSPAKSTQPPAPRVAAPRAVVPAVRPAAAPMSAARIAPAPLPGAAKPATTSALSSAATTGPTPIPRVPVTPGMPRPNRGFVPPKPVSPQPTQTVDTAATDSTRNSK